jgi:hypothetical protein
MRKVKKVLDFCVGGEYNSIVVDDNATLVGLTHEAIGYRKGWLWIYVIMRRYYIGITAKERTPHL